MLPYFSIIVPLYNTPKKYLEQCLNSILSQTYLHWECVVVDNGSSIDSLELMTDPRIKYIRLEDNVGIFLAYQKGFENSSGDLIIHCDSDDWLHKDFLQQIVDNYQESVDTYFMNTISVFDNGYQERAIWPNIGLADYNGMKWFNALCSRKQKSWALWGKVLKRDLLDQTYKIINCNEKIIWSYDCLLCIVYSLFSRQAKMIYFDGFYYRINMDGASFAKITKEKLLGILNSESQVIKILQRILQEQNIDTSNLNLIKQELGKNFISMFYEYQAHSELYNDIEKTVHNVYGLELKPLKKTLFQRILAKDSPQRRVVYFIALKLYNIIKYRR